MTEETLNIFKLGQKCGDEWQSDGPPTNGVVITNSGVYGWHVCMILKMKKNGHTESGPLFMDKFNELSDAIAFLKGMNEQAGWNLEKFYYETPSTKEWKELYHEKNN